MRFLFVFTTMVCILPITMQAQSKVTVSGEIRDTTGEPVSQALIAIEGTTVGTYSNDKGYYSLNVFPGKYTISISALDFKTQKITIEVKKDEKQNFILEKLNVDLSTIEILGKSKAQQLRESAYSVNALNIKSAVNELSSLNTAIGRSSGIKIREEGGVGSDYELSINGLYGNAIRYFVDGVPLSTMGSEVNLANFPVNLVDRVEIYKGFVPSELGADALGGAVNIITNKNIKNYLDASFGFGSFGTYKADVNAQYKDSKTGLIVRPSFGFNYSKNNYKMKGVQVPDEDRDGFITIDAKRFHDDYFSLLGQLEFGVINKKWADSFFLSASYSTMDKELQTGTVQTVVYGKAERKNNSFRLAGNYKKNHFIVDNLSTDISFSYTWDNSVVIDTAYRQYWWNGESGEASRNEITGRGRSKRHIKRPLTVGRINMNYAIAGNHSLNLNYLLNRTGNDRYDDIDVTFEPSNDVLTKQIIGLSYSQSFWNDRLTNILFVKDYINHLKITQTDLSWITGADDVPESSTTNDIGYGIASRFRFKNYLAVKASFEHSIRLPLTRELLGNGTTVYPNLKLKPESSNNVNLGLFGSIDIAHNHRLDYETGLFLRKVEDYIRFKSAEASGIPQYENLGNVTVKGIEGELRYSYANLLQAIVNCSYMEEKNKTKYQTNGQSSITYNKQIPNRPWLYSNFELNVKKQNVFQQKDNQLKLAYYFQYVHWYYYTWKDLGENETKARIPTQCIHNASLTYSLKKERYNISLECNNIFDRTIYDNLKLQKPGRSLFCKLRLFIN